MTDKVKVTEIDQGKIDAMRELIGKLDGLLKPSLSALTPTQRRELPKIGKHIKALWIKPNTMPRVTRNSSRLIWIRRKWN